MTVEAQVGVGRGGPVAQHNIESMQRQISEQIVELVEPVRTKSRGLCCGAGGGRMWMEEEPTQRVNFKRVEQALETSPDAVAVACPFCMKMIDDGLKSKGLEDKVAALDVMEIVASAMKQ